MAMEDATIPDFSGFEADLAVTELFGLIEQSIVTQPRSLQRRIGPSEIGIECDRRVGYILADVPRVKPDTVAWLPFVGTALHEAVGDIVARAEVERFAKNPDTTPRWHIEERVTVGTIGGTDITGSCDLFDETVGLVLDFKFVSRSKIAKQYRPHGPGEQYRTQVHAYGAGFAAKGFDVRHVGVLFMTRDGQFSDRHLWIEEFDPTVAQAALDRANSIHTAIELLGADVALPTLTTAPAYCAFCPWLRVGTTDFATGCPGVGQDPKTLEEMLR